MTDTFDQRLKHAEAELAEMRKHAHEYYPHFVVRFPGEHGNVWLNTAFIVAVLPHRDHHRALVIMRDDHQIVIEESPDAFVRHLILAGPEVKT